MRKMTRVASWMGLLGLLAAGCGPATTQGVTQRQGGKVETKPEGPKEEFVVREVVELAEPEFLDEVNVEAQKSFRQGVLAVYQSPPNYEDAAQQFQTAINHDKNFLEAYFNLGMVRERQGMADAALQVYQQALAANPGNNDVKAYIGKIYMTRAKKAMLAGDTPDHNLMMAQAKSQFDAITVQDPDNVTANNALALYWLLKGNLDSSEDYVKRVLTFEPLNTSALNTRGLIYLKRNELEIARWIFERKVLEQDPNSSEAHTNLGIVYVKENKLPPAVVHFQQAIEVEPDNFEARLNVGAIYLNFLDYARAKEQYEYVLKAQPENVEAMIGFGSSQYGLQQYEDAISTYRKALERDEKRCVLNERIIEIYEARLSQTDTAIAEMEKLIAKNCLPADRQKIYVQKIDLLRKMQKEMKEQPKQPPEGTPPAEDPAAEPGKPGEAATPPAAPAASPRKPGARRTSPDAPAAEPEKPASESQSPTADPGKPAEKIDAPPTEPEKPAEKVETPAAVPEKPAPANPEPPAAEKESTEPKP